MTDFERHMLVHLVDDTMIVSLVWIMARCGAFEVFDLPRPRFRQIIGLVIFVGILSPVRL